MTAIWFLLYYIVKLFYIPHNNNSIYLYVLVTINVGGNNGISFYYWPIYDYQLYTQCILWIMIEYDNSPPDFFGK